MKRTKPHTCHNILSKAQNNFSPKRIRLLETFTAVESNANFELYCCFQLNSITASC